MCLGVKVNQFREKMHMSKWAQPPLINLYIFHTCRYANKYSDFATYFLFKLIEDIIYNTNSACSATASTVNKSFQNSVNQRIKNKAFNYRSGAFVTQVWLKSNKACGRYGQMLTFLTDNTC